MVLLSSISNFFTNKTSLANKWVSFSSFNSALELCYFVNHVVIKLCKGRLACTSLPVGIKWSIQLNDYGFHAQFYEVNLLGLIPSRGWKYCTIGANYF